MTKGDKDSVRGSSKPSKSIPDFMIPDSDEDRRQSLTENIDLWVDAATYGSLSAGHWEDRLSLIMMAKEVTEAARAAQWSDAVGRTHVDLGLLDGSGQRNSHDELVRSFYLRTALLHLLEIVEAPAHFKDDVSRWLDHKMPKIAPKRGAVQRVLIEQPELTGQPAQLAKEAACSRRLVDRYLKEGSVQLMP